MLNFKRVVFTLLTAGCSLAMAGSNLKLAENGKAAYKIVFDKSNSSLPEKTAVNELENFLEKVTGTQFFKTADIRANDRFISVGHTEPAKKFLGRDVIDSLKEEEFIIKSSPEGNIFIVGGRPRGTLYGVLHFLDNIVGVRWLLYDYTYIPSLPDLTLPVLDVRRTPDFVQRFVFITSRHPAPIDDITWQYRNRINYTMYHGDWYQKYMKRGDNPEKFPELPDKEYGINNFYTPPAFVHTIPRLIPAKKYFKTHPEWWELIDGKRQNNQLCSAMCLTNEELVKETAKQAMEMIDSSPDSQYISISEGDTIKNYCQCDKCQAAIKKYNAKSGLMLQFVNKVAEIIHKRYPEIIVTTLAYMHSEKAPDNIKAGKNILVRLCIWTASNSEPYDDPKNEGGQHLLKNLAKWKTICPNIGIWDYVTTYYKNFIPHPNLHTIIPNLKILKEAGVDYFLCEADHNYGGYRSGESAARIFLLSRGMCDVNADTNALLQDFTDKFYGKKSGTLVREYWNLLLRANRDRKYMGIAHSGCGSDAPYLQLPVVLKAEKLLKEAVAAAAPGKNREHAEQLYMQIQFVLLDNWKRFETEAKTQGLEMPGTFEKHLADFTAQTEKYKAWHINYESREKALNILKESYCRNFNVTASKAFGSKAEFAFDRNGKTGWNGGGFHGWLQMEYKEPKTISSVYTIFNYKDKSVTYEITGSLDGKTWQTLVPKRTTTNSVIIQNISASHPMITARDKFAPVKVRFVRTRIFKVVQVTGKPDWIVIREQEIE